MYCSKCGKEIHNDAKFCIYCGNKIKKNKPDHSKYEKFDYAPVVLRAEQGDEEAFTTLWAKTNQPYRYYIYLQSKNKDAVDDILQESYRRIFKDIMEKKLQNPEAFFSWGKRIVLNTTADHYRKYKYETQEEKVSESTADENDVKDFYKEDYATDFNPEAQITQNEVSDILQDIIGDLPESQKNCILLWMDEYTTDEIAEILGMSSGTVKSNVNYAKKKIKTKVEDLEKQGVKLYSMAPFTFFVWIMDQFDQNAASAAPSVGNVSLFDQIMQQIHIANNVAKTEISIEQASKRISDAAEKHMDTTIKQSKTSTMKENEAERIHASENKVSEKLDRHSDISNSSGFGNDEKAGVETVKKSFVSTVNKKIIIGTISAILVIGGSFGIIHYHATHNSFDTVHQDQEDPNSTHNNPNEKQMDAAELSKIINKEYIGNQLYYSESDMEVPTGCIEAVLNDIDNDGNDELITIENDDSSFSFKPSLNIYKINKKLNKISSELINLDLNIVEVSDYSSENVFIQKYVKFFIYENNIIVQYENDENANYPSFKNTTYSFEDNSLTNNGITDNLSNKDLHEKGLEFCSIFVQKLPTTVIPYIGGSSIWGEENKTGYLINFVDYTKLTPMESENDASHCIYNVPLYYKEYFKITTPYAEGNVVDDVMTDKKYSCDMILFTYGKHENSRFDTESDGFPFSELYQDKLIYSKGENGITMNFFVNRQDARTDRSIRAISELTLEMKDLKHLSIFIMMFADSNEIPYHLSVE